MCSDKAILYPDTKKRQRQTDFIVCRWVRWHGVISRVHSWGNNALDKRSAQLGRDDSHPSWQLSTKPPRRRWCHSPKTWLIDVRCRMQIDLQLSFVPGEGLGETERARDRGRRREITAGPMAMAAGVIKQSSRVWLHSRLIASKHPWNLTEKIKNLRWRENAERVRKSW